MGFRNAGITFRNTKLIPGDAKATPGNAGVSPGDAGTTPACSEFIAGKNFTLISHEISVFVQNNHKNLMIAARETAKQAFKGQDVMLRDAFQVGVNKPNS